MKFDPLRDAQGCQEKSEKNLARNSNCIGSGTPQDEKSLNSLAYNRILFISLIFTLLYGIEKKIGSEDELTSTSEETFLLLFFPT